RRCLGNLGEKCQIEAWHSSERQSQIDPSLNARSRPLNPSLNAKSRPVALQSVNLRSIPASMPDRGLALLRASMKHYGDYYCEHCTLATFL
ncbi:hypothetical protein AVEN_148459-1, partial [Araneus ventricosus]